MMFCWLCKMLTYGRSPFKCRCRSMWLFGGPPAELRGNPLGVHDPPEWPGA